MNDMQKVFTLPIILLFFVAAHTQEHGRRAVVWSGANDCGYKSKAVSPDESIMCGSLETPRGFVSTINHEGVNLAVAFLENADFIIVATQIKNTTNMPFEFDTDLWGAAHFATRDGFYQADRPLLAETAIPSRDIVRGIRSGVNLDNSMDTFMAGVAKTVEVKMVRRSDGTLVRSERIVDDQEAKRRAGSGNEIRSEHATEEQERIRKTAMTQKWVTAGGSARGLVYFRRVKQAGLVVFSFRVLDTTYIFRLLRKKS